VTLVAQFRDVFLRRGTATILADLSLTIEEGQRWVIVGPNGAGKTTILSLLAAQSFPSAGTISLLGETLGRVDVFDLRPRIGIAGGTVADRISGREKVLDVVLSAAYGIIGRWREDYFTEDIARAERMLENWGVKDLSYRTFGSLSEGEKKRVEIARALMTDPELLLLDEPSAGLDLSGREQLLQSLAELCFDKKAPTIVLVTHHLEEIPRGITDVLLLSNGRAIASGPLSETLTAENLSLTYEMPIALTEQDGRWTAYSPLAPDSPSPGSEPSGW